MYTRISLQTLGPGLVEPHDQAHFGDPKTANDRSIAGGSITALKLTRSAAASRTGAGSSLVSFEASLMMRLWPTEVPLKTGTLRIVGAHGESPPPCGPPPPPPHTPTVEQGKSQGRGVLQAPSLLWISTVNAPTFWPKRRSSISQSRSKTELGGSCSSAAAARNTGEPVASGACGEAERRTDAEAREQRDVAVLSEHVGAAVCAAGG